jgi:hypothetical protein
MRFKKINEHKYRRLTKLEEFCEDVKDRPFRGLCLVAVVALVIVGIVGALIG